MVKSLIEFYADKISEHARAFRLDESSLPAHVKNASNVLKKTWPDRSGSSEKHANMGHQAKSNGRIMVDSSFSKTEAAKHASGHVAELAKHGIKAKPVVTATGTAGRHNPHDEEDGGTGYAMYKHGVLVSQPE